MLIMVIRKNFSIANYDRSVINNYFLDEIFYVKFWKWLEHSTSTNETLTSTENFSFNVWIDSEKRLSFGERNIIPLRKRKGSAWSMERNNTIHETNEEWKKKGKAKIQGWLDLAYFDCYM